MRASWGHDLTGPFLFWGDVVDGPPLVLKPTFQIPTVGAGEPWPYRGTLEQMEAARARLETVREVHGKNSREFRSAAISFTRLKRLKVPVLRPRSKLRADEEHRQRMIIERGKAKVAAAEKAIENLYDIASTGRSAILMRQFVKLAEDYGPKIMEERLKDENPLTRYRALGELIDLLKTAYRTEEDKTPKRKAAPRQVVVRGWPAEGAKS